VKGDEDLFDKYSGCMGIPTSLDRGIYGVCGRHRSIWKCVISNEQQVLNGSTDDEETDY